MAKKILEVQDIRRAAAELNDSDLDAVISQMSDEEFLDSKFECDLELDSLEVTELTMNLEKDFDISIPDSSFHFFKRNGNTVRAMLEEYNRVLQYM